MSKSYGNHDRDHRRRRRRCTGARCRSPTRRWARGTTCCWARAPPAGASARDAKRALARELVDALPRRRRRRGGRGAASTACSWRASCPRTSRRPSRRPTATVHLPALLAELFGGSRSDARRKIAQGGVRLDGEPLSRRARPAAPTALDGARAAGRASAASAGCAGRGLTAEPAAGRPRRLLHVSRRSGGGRAERSGRSLFRAPSGRRYHPLPARSGLTGAESAPGRNPPHQGAPVFENSTACAPIRCRGDGSMCVQVRSIPVLPSRGGRTELKTRRCVRGRHLCTRRPSVMRRQLS